MLSIIICSTKTDISIALRQNIDSSIGIKYEIIVVDNSNKDYSIFSAYNQGFSQSKYPNLCFCHEDILFSTEDWGKNLLNHLSDEQAGIIGVAGGKIISRIPAHWWATGAGSKNLIQHSHQKISNVERSEGFVAAREPAILLDGVFLSCRRNLFEKIKFDETLSGFHGYDQDISLQSTAAGYHNYVVSDILIEHFSKGNINAQYYENLLKVYRKWQIHLPLFSADITEEQKVNLAKTEIKLLVKLIRRMAQTGFNTNEIIDEAKYYISILNTPKAKKILNFIHLKIAFEKIFHSR